MRQWEHMLTGDASCCRHTQVVGVGIVALAHQGRLRGMAEVAGRDVSGHSVEPLTVYPVATELEMLDVEPVEMEFEVGASNDLPASSVVGRRR